MGRVCVTGSAGFIGSHLALSLLEGGAEVLGIDNLDPFYDAALKRGNIELCAQAGGDRFTHAEIDICNTETLSRVVKEYAPDAIVHLAAKAGVRPSIADPVGYARTNVVGTSSVLEAARLCGARAVCVASSSSVYGNNRKTPFAEDDDVRHPISPYAATKLATEALCHAHHHLTGTPVCCLRFFTVYGPRQRPDLAIGKFLAHAEDGRAITMFGDGSTSRDYTYIDDIISGVLSSMSRVGERGYRVWNLGSDQPVRLDALVELIGEATGRRIEIERAPAQAGDVERTWADLTRSRLELGYNAATPLAGGIAAQLAWMRLSRSV